MRPRLAAVVLAAVPMAGVVAFDPGGWSPFGPVKWLAVAGLGLAGATVVVGAPLAVSRRAAMAWLAFVAWVGVAAAVGLDGRYAWLGTPQRRFGVLTWVLCAVLFLAGHRLEDEGDARVVVAAAVAACGLAGGWAAAEALGWRPVRLAATDRVVGPMGSAAFLGAALVLLVPVAVGVAADGSWSRRSRYGAALAATLGTVGLVASGARAAWLGALAAGGVIAWTNRALIAARLWRTLWVAAASIAALTGLAVLTGVAGRVPDLWAGGPAGGSSRLAEWHVGVRVLAAHPVTGVGPEGYRIAFGPAVDRGYQRRYGRLVLPDRTHDGLLDVAVTTGLVGLALYLALLALVGTGVWRALRASPTSPRSGPHPVWLVGMAAGLVGYGIQQLLLFPVSALEPGAWLLAGVVLAHTARPQDLVIVRLPRPGQVLLGALAALTVVAGARDVLADRAVESALVALDAGQTAASRVRAAHAVALAPGDIDTRIVAARAEMAPAFDPDLPAARAQVDAAQRVSPHDPVVAALAADLAVQIATRSGRAPDWARARRVVTAALAGDPRNPDLLLQAGIADAATGDDAAATATWMAAADLAPRSAAPLADLATLYLRGGETAAAATAARQALARDPGDGTAQGVLARLAAHGT